MNEHLPNPRAQLGRQTLWQVGNRVGWARVTAFSAFAAFVDACAAPGAPRLDEDADAAISVPQDVATDVQDGDADASATETADGPETETTDASDAEETQDLQGSNGFIDLQVTPARAVYRPGELVSLEAQLWDRFGEQVPDAEFEIRVSGPGTIVDELQIRLDAEGLVQVEVCEIAGAPCAERLLHTDAGAPTIVIDYPPSGAAILDLGEGLEVRGHFEGAANSVDLRLNGLSVEVQADGSFAKLIVPKFGVNHLSFVAFDGVSSRFSSVAADFIAAPRFLPRQGGSTAPVVHVTNAISLKMGQSFVDDGAPLATPDENGVIVTRDLTDLLEFLVTNLDFESQIPDPVVSSGTLMLRVPALDPGHPDVRLNITGEGLELFVQLPEIVAETQGEFVWSGDRLDLTGSVRAGVAATLALQLDKPESGPLVVTVSGAEIALINPESQFASAQADAVFELAEGILFDTIEDLFVGLISEVLVGEIPQIIEGLFDSVAGAISGQQFVLDTGFGAPIALSLDAQLHQLLTQGRRQLVLSLDTVVGAGAPSLHPDSPGVATEFAGSPQPVWFSASALEAALDTGLVNALLFSLWDAGLLEIDLTELLPPEISILADRVVVSGKLPPLLAPALASESDSALLLAVGQLELQISRGAQTDTMGAYVATGVDFVVADNRLQIVLPDLPVIALWQIDTNGATPIFSDPSALENVVLQVLWPEIEQSIGEVGIDLPTIDLSSASDLVPGLESLILQIRLDSQIAERNGFLMVGGRLEGEIDVD